MKKPLFIAEVSSNHQQDIERCFHFVDVAADLGCWAVKFQLFKINSLFAPEALEKKPELRARKQWELPVSFLPAIAERCNKKNIQFSCTPFYLRAVNELFPYVDFYKIASYEMLWSDLLTACASTGKPVVFSTGMATIEEVEQAFHILVNAGCNDLTLLHCVSGYPTPVADCNLSVIETLRNKFNNEKQNIKISFGWSDHSVNPAVIYRAVHRWGAETVEFHLDLEGQGAEFLTGHCWLPQQISPVIEQVINGFTADGDSKKLPASSEISDRDWRADPSDGLRPLLKTRETLNKER
jgi:N-acetylneuraminate synthase